MTPSAPALAYPFVHPAMAAAGLALGAIPILIHLINRRRYVRVPWAAITFLLAARRKSAARVRLEQWLLLLLRVAVIALMGFAVARPYLPFSAALALSSSRSHRVLLIDNSLSMNAQDNQGRRRFDAARSQAEALLAWFPTTDAVSLVALARPAEAVLAQPAYDRRDIRERLAAIGATEQATDVEGAIEHTLRLLQASDAAPGNRFVYLISDLQKNLWVTPTPDIPTPAAAALRRLADALGESGERLSVIRVAPDAAENLAVTALVTETSFHAVGVAVPVSVEVTQFGPATARQATLELRHRGRIIRREPLASIAPGASSQSEMTVEFQESGTHALEARVSTNDRDSLADDNARFLSIEIRKTTPVLLVDGRPGSTKLGGHAGFLATALRPQTVPHSDDTTRWVDPKPEGNLLDPKIITEVDLEGEVLPDYAVIVLCNVPGLTAEQWTNLDGFVAHGGGLMVFAGDRINPENYNRFGFSGGAGPLPGPFGAPTDAPAAADPHGTNLAEPEMGFRAETFVHPMLLPFSEHPNSGLFLARVRRFLPVEIDPRRTHVLLRYTNDQPALIASHHGHGKVLVCTTTANMDWTNLPAKGDFVALMLKAMEYLSPRRGEHRNLVVGQSIDEPVSAAQSSFPCSLTDPAGTRVRPSLVPGKDSLSLHSGPLPRGGVYALSLGTDVTYFAVNRDPVESALAAADEQEFKEALRRPVGFQTDPVAVSTSGTPRTTELNRLAFYGLAGLLWVEIALAMLFHRQAAMNQRIDAGGRAKP